MPFRNYLDDLKLLSIKIDIVFGGRIEISEENCTDASNEPVRVRVRVRVMVTV